MAQLFRSSWRPRLGYWSTAPLSGESRDYIFRGRNFIVQGGGDLAYAELWKGLDVPQPALGIAVVAEDSTATKSASSDVVTLTLATGTSLGFDLLMPGQTIIVFETTTGKKTPLIITSIISRTQATVSPIDVSFTDAKWFISWIIQDVDSLRATFRGAGSVIKFPRGAYVSTGARDRGFIRLDGAIQNSLNIGPRPEIGIKLPNISTGTPWTTSLLGFSSPSTVSAAIGSAGSKNMQIGRYSVRIVPARILTQGFNNPSPTAEVTLTAAGQTIQITFPAMDTIARQDAWRVYGTLYSTQEANSGPWYYVTTLTSTQVSASGGTFNVEWRDAEIAANDILAFDNDMPPKASFITVLGGIPLLLGCNGAGRRIATDVAVTNNSSLVSYSGAIRGEPRAGETVYFGTETTPYLVTSANFVSFNISPVYGGATAASQSVYSADDAPGPVVRPCQPSIGGYNVEAYPARLAVALNPPEDIIGYVEGVGRIYLLTVNRLHIVTLSGDSSFPITVRPFWRTGFQNPRACTFVNGYLYGFTTLGATRSAGSGDVVAEEHEFARPVQYDMNRWNPSLVIVNYDPKNEAVVYIQSNAGINSNGKYYSEALMYMLRTGVWSTPIRLENPDPTLDFFVTSGTTVKGRLYILAHHLTTITEVDILVPEVYEWDTVARSGTIPLISGYLAMPFIDEGAEGLDKNIHGLSIVGYSATPLEANIYGAGSEMDIPVSALEQKTPSNSGLISYVAGLVARMSQRRKLNVQRVKNYSVRLDIQAPASVTNPGRVDEVIIDGNVTQHKY